MLGLGLLAWPTLITDVVHGHQPLFHETSQIEFKDGDLNVVIVIYVTNMMVITKKMLLKVMLFMDISQPLFHEVSYFEYKNGNWN